MVEYIKGWQLKDGTIYQAQMATGTKSPKRWSDIRVEDSQDRRLTSRILGFKIAERSPSDSSCGGTTQVLV